MEPGLSGEANGGRGAETRPSPLAGPQAWGLRTDLLLGVDLDRNAATVVVDGDRVGGAVDGHLEEVHRGVAHFVVGRVHENLVKDLVQTRHELDRAVDHLREVAHRVDKGSG